MNFIEICFNNGKQLINLDAIRYVDFDSQKNKTTLVYSGSAKNQQIDGDGVYNAVKNSVLE